MTKFVLEAQHSIHNGGTKYYQVIGIYNYEAGVSATITHWGAYHEGAPSYPRLHGQNKIELEKGTSKSPFNAARKNKEKRGYDSWKEETYICSSGTEMLEMLGKWFSAAGATLLADHLVKTTKASVEEPKEVVIPKKVEPEKAASSSMKEWGTW